MRTVHALEISRPCLRRAKAGRRSACSRQGSGCWRQPRLARTGADLSLRGVLHDTGQGGIRPVWRLDLDASRKRAAARWKSRRRAAVHAVRDRAPAAEHAAAMVACLAVRPVELARMNRDPPDNGDPRRRRFRDIDACSSIWSARDAAGCRFGIPGVSKLFKHTLRRAHCQLIPRCSRRRHQPYRLARATRQLLTQKYSPMLARHLERPVASARVFTTSNPATRAGNTRQTRQRSYRRGLDCSGTTTHVAAGPLPTMVTCSFLSPLTDEALAAFREMLDARLPPGLMGKRRAPTASADCIANRLADARSRAPRTRTRVSESVLDKRGVAAVTTTS